MKRITVTGVLWVVMLAGALALIPSCNKVAEKKAHPLNAGQPELISYAVGKSWSYEVAHFDSTGKKVTSWISTTRVIGDSLLNDELWYVMQEDSAGTPLGMPYIAANRAGGLYSIDITGSPSLLYKYPANVGDRCPEAVLVSKDTTIICGKDKYVCYCYQLGAAEKTGDHKTYVIVSRDFFSPGVGLVKHEQFAGWQDSKGGAFKLEYKDSSELTAR